VNGDQKPLTAEDAERAEKLVWLSVLRVLSGERLLARGSR
jgi:hypothetical protein